MPFQSSCLQQPREEPNRHVPDVLNAPPFPPQCQAIRRLHLGLIPEALWLDKGSDFSQDSIASQKNRPCPFSIQRRFPISLCWAPQ
jgi:hypothetical protein